MNYETNGENCAILVFARSNSFENDSKKLLRTNKKNKQLWNALNQKVVDISQKSGLPYYISNETDQVGNNFGERISQSIATIFDKGFDKIIVIGNDCPELNVRHLKEAHLQLKSNDIVFGPDHGGGAYLLGISKNHFKAADFKNFNWQSSHALNDLTSYYKNASSFILPYLYDVNNLFSFKKSLTALDHDSDFKKFLLALLDNILLYTFFLELKVNLSILPFLNYRGPPKSVFNYV